MTKKHAQGPWTRIRPLQKEELDPYTRAAIAFGESTWGGFPTNLLKVMAYCGRLTETEVPYANSFIFDPPSFRGDVQEAGFNDRFLKELVISRVSMVNRSAYSVTHHALIGMGLFAGAGSPELGRQKYLHLHEHESHGDLYTPRESTVLDYAVKVARDPHDVTDEEFAALRDALHYHNQLNGLKEEDTRSGT
jgi:alkylhydroperoxidase family enzyme